VLDLFLASIERLRTLAGDFPVVCVSDEEDKSTCAKNAVVHITQANKPVSLKWNTGFKYLRDLGNVDYVMIVGSDDLISSALMLNLIDAMNKDYDLIGIRSIYFYGAYGQNRGKLIHISRAGILGVCRTIHRRVLDNINWTPFPKAVNYAMDGLCMRTISPWVKSQACVEGDCFDIKNHNSMNRIEFWMQKVKERTAPEIMYDQLSDKELKILKML